MLIVDSHLDLSPNALTWNPDITLPVAAATSMAPTERSRAPRIWTRTATCRISPPFWNGEGIPVSDFGAVMHGNWIRHFQGALK